MSDVWNAVPLRETILAVITTMPAEAAPEHVAAQVESQVRAWLDRNAGDQEYVYRAATERIKWYHRDTLEEAREDRGDVADDAYVERCPVERWERVQ